MFSKSTALKKVNLPDGIQTIPKEMFYRCKSLTEVNIPASVKEIGSNAFDGCENLNLGTITLDCSMGEFAFRHVKFDTLTVKSKVVTNGLHESRINKLIFAEGVETIEDHALALAKIGDISFPTTLKTIGNSAFGGVDVEKFIFNSAIHFDYGAFNNCKMKEVVILSGSTLNKYVFMNCHQLETIYFSGTRSEWGRLVDGYGGVHKRVICSDD